jgi:hypothetical protein
MRTRAYFLFELVAWPAAVWSAVELLLRATTGASSGIGSASLTGGCAVLTVFACRVRAMQLSRQAVR